MNVASHNSQSFGLNILSIGEICITKYEAENGHEIVMVAIFSSPN